MKKTDMSRLGCAAVIAGLALTGPAQAQTPLPRDVLDTCVVSPTAFAGWQASPGVFTPADSTTFNDATDCNFFIWGARMFLWLTSATNGTYVFDGPDFLDVVGNEYVALSGSQSGVGQFAPRTEKQDDETGVAQTGGSGVLISPAGEIVHYGVKVNDLYAYYQTGVKSADHPANFSGDLANDFPTTAGDLQQITDYVSRVFKTDIPQGEALAMELKTSWVDAASLDHPEDYVTIDATVSVYDHTSPAAWVQTGTAVRRMALVGFHVVGSVNNHPEMVWATFDHINNAPQNPYIYINVFGEAVEAPYDGNVPGTRWTFNADPHETTTPVLAVVERATHKTIKYHVTEKITVDISAIVADQGQTVGPNTVVRINPWGDAPAEGLAAMDAPYGSGSTAITRATDLISLNRSILNQLAAGDVRRNYIQTGSIWSSGGPDAIPTSGTDPVLRGTLRLANSTMETFHQFPDSHGTGSFKPENCFGCHSVATNSSPSQGVSHIFGKLTPLAPN